MASAEYYWHRLRELLARDLNKDELLELLPKLKLDVDDYDDEKVIVDVTPDRPDLFSEEAAARLINFYKGWRKPYEFDISTNPDYIVNVALDNARIRPFTAAAVVEDIDFNDEMIRTIIRVQEKLHATLGRNRSKIAIGIYPLDKISFPINFTSLPKHKIRFVPLGCNYEMTADDILNKHETGKQYKHLLKGLEKYPLFVDSNNNILSMPPIINSQLTGKVNEDTRAVFIECSGFDMFAVDFALKLLLTMFYDMGSKLFAVQVVYPNDYVNSLNKKERFSYELFNEEFGLKQGHIYVVDLGYRKMKIDYNFIDSILGLEFGKEKINQLLQRMGYIVNGNYAFIPCYRQDVLHQVDLAEDVAIAFGYDNVEPQELLISSFGKADEFQTFVSHMNELVLGMSIQPIKTYSLIDDTSQKPFVDQKSLVYVINPMSKEYNTFRSLLLPGLIDVLQYNKTKAYPQRIFEIGEVYFNHEGRVVEEQHLSILLAGDYTFTDIKQVMQSIFDFLNLEPKLHEQDYEFLIPGRSTKITVKDDVIGFMGELHPKVIMAHDLEVNVVCLEINLSKVFKLL